MTIAYVSGAGYLYRPFACTHLSRASHCTG